MTVYATAAPGRAGRGAADWTTLRRAFPVSPDRIEGRLGLARETGAFLECVLGFLPAKITGAGYLYPTRDALVAGVVVATPLSAGGPDAARRALDALCSHAAIAPLLAPASASQEVGAPASVGTSPGSPDSGDAYLALGAAPGASYGTVAGAPSADRELARGLAAGEVVVEALRGGAPTAAALGRFLPRLRALERSWAQASHGIALDPRSGGEYPRLAAEALHELLNESGRPKESIAAALRRVRRAARLSWYRLGVDALAVGRAL